MDQIIWNFSIYGRVKYILHSTDTNVEWIYMITPTKPIICREFHRSAMFQKIFTDLLYVYLPGFPKFHFFHSKLSRLTVQQYAITGKRSKYSTILGSPQPPILNLTVFFSVSSPSVVYLLSTLVQILIQVM